MTTGKTSDTVAASAAAATDATSAAGATTGRSNQMTLAEALSALDDANDEHWNKDGSPKMAVIEDLVGDKSLTKADVEAHAAYRVRSAGAPDTAPGASGSNEVADLRARIEALEADVAFLRRTFGWPKG